MNEIKDQIGKEKGGARDFKSKEGGVKGTMVRHWFIGWGWGGGGGGPGREIWNEVEVICRTHTTHTEVIH